MTNKWVYRCSYLWHYHLFFLFFFLCLSRLLSKPNEHNTRKTRAHKKQAELSIPYKTDQSKCWSISNLTCHFFRLYRQIDIFLVCTKQQCSIELSYEKYTRDILSDENEIFASDTDTSNPLTQQQKTGSIQRQIAFVRMSSPVLKH